MLKRNNNIFLVLFFCLLCSHAYGEGLKLNELCIIPKTNQPQWIELLNTSDVFIKASEYKLVSDAGEITFSEDIGSIASGGVMLVVFDGVKGVKREGKTTVVHLLTKNFLKPQEGFLTLSYFSSRINDKTKKSYQQWHDVDSITWGKNKMILLDQMPGVTLGVFPGSKWMNYGPKDITPGSLNKKVFYPPTMNLPEQGHASQQCPSWSWETLAPKTMVQFSDNEYFTPVLTRVVVTNTRLDKCPRVLKPGTKYFWRLRAQDDEGHMSSWTEARSFSFKL